MEKRGVGNIFEKDWWLFGVMRILVGCLWGGGDERGIREVCEVLGVLWKGMGMWVEEWI